MVTVSQFDIITAETIKRGDATDAYFDRTVETLDHAGTNPHVVAEITADQFPTGEFELFAGVKDAAHLLENLPIDVDALPEGTLFDGGPVFQIEGTYLDFARYETALLGFLSHASGIATNALETRYAAPDSLVLSFGTRHVHPTLGGIIERAALLAGLDGFSNVAAEEFVDQQASGTMPHALMLCFGKGNQEAAWQAFDDAVDESVPRITLCDTFSDEVDEVLRAVDALGDRLDSVRLDTTGSRRGDFEHIIREVRWELDARGQDDVDIFVSGGITPDTMRDLRDHVAGFGVGGYISNADPIDFALDIVEVDRTPTAKRGKLSGKKAVYRTSNGGHHVGLADRSGPSNGEELLEPLIRDGEIVREFDLDEASKRSNANAERVSFSDQVSTS
ncbi:nicotinate phosphoribosyltransferase [Natronorubrum tibetense]|uniref:Nicotinate phosphoribosyltransferase n=1 Tax=Natronorubrum tibetense GA33 TaxID=1114856 RepID=L9VF02_9EURY|nr:nicotinate phosphoribosyltransferase [Natronorubrum tibetense]ELY35522.1 nicotinate phosphoribosyltransferase [Natronorubrum tibetense GA33]